VEFQAAGVVGNPWWFQRQRLAVGSCAHVGTGGLVPALGCLRCGAFQKSEQFDREGKYQGGILLCGDLDDGLQKSQLQRGWVLGYDLGCLAINSTLPPKSRVTIDSLRTHRARHFDAGVASVWRAIVEQRAAAEMASYEDGVANLVDSRTFLEAVVARSYAGVIDEGMQISTDQGISAAKELGLTRWRGSWHSKIAS
jgi:hypothetical protein